jgi:hypothetical protein
MTNNSNNSNGIGDYLSYAQIDIDKHTLTVNGNNDYSMKIREKKVSLDYVAGIIVNICQRHNLEYNEESLNTCAVETHEKYTEEVERRNLKLRLLAEARKYAADNFIKEESLEVRLCKAYLEHILGRPPSPISMKAWTPPETADVENIGKLWDDFTQESWEHQAAVLAVAGATDFLGFTEWAQRIKDQKGSGGSEKKSRANVAIKLVKERTKEFFIDQHETPYAEITIKREDEKNNNSPEFQVAYAINSSRFKNWLRLAYYRASKGDILSREDLQSVCDILSAQITMDNGKKHRRMMHVRVAPASNENEGPVAYYDLLDSEYYQAVKLTASGWTIEQPPAIFLRFRDQLPQVTPSRQYEADVFDKFMALTNVKSNDDKLLIECYIISLFIPMIPFPILMPHGPSGASKSMLQKYIQKIVDPNSNDELLSLPTDINELIQQISHHYLSYYDNLSYMPSRISDVFCRAATGGGISKRVLYTDNDDISYKFKRPTGFNGMTLVASNSDLIERGLIVELERINKKKRRSEKELWAEFDSLLPELLGYILDIVVKVLHVIKKQGGIEMDEHPRMADWAEVCEIISQAMGNPDHAFLHAYYRNIGLQTQESIKANPIAECIVKLMMNRELWVGSASGLLEELEQIAINDLKMKNLHHNKSWPKAPNVLSRRLNTVVTNLLEIGISLEKIPDASNHTTVIQIRKSAPIISPISPNPRQDENRTQNEPKSDGDTLPSVISPTISPSQNRAQNGDTGITGTLLDTFAGVGARDHDDDDGNGKDSNGNKVQKDSTGKYTITPERYFGCQHSGCTSYFSDPLQLLSHIQDAGHGDAEEMKSWLEMRGLIGDDARGQ